jgi:hypothetical protein
MEKDFPIAYAYWTFVKGYRYVLDLPKRPAYVFHWLREDACIQGVTSTSTEDSVPALTNLFPWGPVLNEVLRLLPELATADEELYQIMVKLRSFTRENAFLLSPSLANVENSPSPFTQMQLASGTALRQAWHTYDELHAATTRFLSASFESALPFKWERHIVLSTIVTKVISDHIVVWLPGLKTFVALIKGSISVALDNLPDFKAELYSEPNFVQRTVRMQRYRATADDVLKEPRVRTAVESFHAAKGWLPRR